MEIADGNFKIGLLKEFWDRRNRELVPPSGKGIGIKKQKFLVFYNLFANTLGKENTLENLKAFKQGPVYYDVYSHIKSTNEYLEQRRVPKQIYCEDIINATKILLESESHETLSNLTHTLDLWKNNYDSDYDESIIKQDFQFDDNNIELKDISNRDKKLLRILYEYNLNIFNNYNLIKIKNKLYAIEKENQDKIMLIINSDNQIIKNILAEVSMISTLGKLNYDESQKDNELEGVIIDI